MGGGGEGGEEEGWVGGSADRHREVSGRNQSIGRPSTHPPIHRTPDIISKQQSKMTYSPVEVDHPIVNDLWYYKLDFYI